jgi:polar amino acid transport system permease protein
MIDYVIATTGYILKGCGLTLSLCAVTVLGSVPVAILFALGRVSGHKHLDRALGLYAWIFRGTPLLLQLFFIYYGLSIFGISLSPFTAASVTFIINYAAYLMEIFRAGIQSIDRGQYEAAKALNMSYVQSMRRIILPQAIKRTLPPCCNEAITLIKDTALVIVIGMGDLLRSAKEVFTRDFRITPFIIAAVIYLVMTSGVIAFFRKIEDKLGAWE